MFHAGYIQIIPHDQQVNVRGEWTIVRHYSIIYMYFGHYLYFTWKCIHFCRFSCVLHNKRFITKSNHIFVGIEFCRWIGGVFIYPICCNISHSNYIRFGIQDIPTISWLNIEGGPGGVSTKIRSLMILDNSSKFHCQNHCVILQTSIRLGGIIAITEIYQSFTYFSSHSIILFAFSFAFVAVDLTNVTAFGSSLIQAFLLCIPFLKFPFPLALLVPYLLLWEFGTPRFVPFVICQSWISDICSGFKVPYSSFECQKRLNLLVPTPLWVPVTSEITTFFFYYFSLQHDPLVARGQQPSHNQCSYHDRCQI